MTESKEINSFFPSSVLVHYTYAAYNIKQHIKGPLNTVNTPFITFLPSQNFSMPLSYLKFFVFNSHTLIHCGWLFIILLVRPLCVIKHQLLDSC